AVPVTPVIHPGLALNLLINQLVALVRIGAARECSELISRRDTPGQIEVDAAAEFVIVRERRVRSLVFLHRAEEVFVNQVADGELLPIRAGVRQFRGDAAREFADLLIGALRIELIVRVLAGKPVFAGSLFLRLKRTGSEPDRNGDPERDER